MKPLFWIGGSRSDYGRLPKAVQKSFGLAIMYAQLGGKHPTAKPLSGFGDAGMLEIVERLDGGTYRAIYTVRFADAVFVLHAFQKKSVRGIATPRREIDLVRQRLATARREHESWLRVGSRTIQ